MKVKTRLTLYIAGVGFFASLILCAVVIYELLEQPFRIVDETLRAQTRLFSAAVSNARWYGVKGSILADRPGSPGRLFWVRVRDADSGEDVYRSPLAESLPMPEVELGRKANLRLGHASATGGIVVFRAMNSAVELEGREYHVQAAYKMDKLYYEIIEVFIWVATGLALSLLVSFALAGAAGRKIIEPIREIDALAHNISEKNLAGRIPVSDEGDELSELALTLNGMLDRLQYSFSRQREFLYDTSHELKTPLTTMRLAVQSLCSGSAAGGAEMEETLERLESQIWRMDRLVKDLLQLSSMEARNALDLSPENVSAMVADMAEEYAIMAGQRGIKIALDLPEEPLFMICDREKLGRAVSNVLDNAIKHNVDGGAVRVALESSAGTVRAIFENSGEGVPDGESERVFDRFYRGEKSRTFTKESGFGLGLAIVKKIVELHGGNVLFESAQGWNRLSMEFPITEKPGGQL